MVRPLHSAARVMRSIILALLFTWVNTAWAQSGAPTESGRIELLNADRGEYDDRIDRAHNA